jgi:uncharacterized protein (DUF2141 family)
MKQLGVGVLSLFAIGGLVFSSSVEAITSGNLTVTIDGLKSQKGQVCLSVFSSSQGFPNKNDRALAIQCVKLAGSSPTATFGNLKAGNYAIAVIHDANSDSKLNSNAFGIPTEGFGFSRNPKILTGPPKFADSSVLVVGASTDVQIQMQYLFGAN